LTSPPAQDKQAFGRLSLRLSFRVARVEGSLRSKSFRYLQYFLLRFSSDLPNLLQNQPILQLHCRQTAPNSKRPIARLRLSSREPATRNTAGGSQSSATWQVIKFPCFCPLGSHSGSQLHHPQLKLRFAPFLAPSCMQQVLMIEHHAA
jgi:hypothetical protein